MQSLLGSCLRAIGYPAISDGRAILRYILDALERNSVGEATCGLVRLSGPEARGTLKVQPRIGDGGSWLSSSAAMQRQSKRSRTLKDGTTGENIRMQCLASCRASDELKRAKAGCVHGAGAAAAADAVTTSTIRRKVSISSSTLPP